MLDTASITLNATDVWRVIKTFEQALEVLHAGLDDDVKADPSLDPVYRGYLELYERFKDLAEILPEPEIDETDD